MPYSWSPPQQDTSEATIILTLWPHLSLPPKGFAAIILLAFLLITVPLFGLLGTVFLWGLLPFTLMAIAALWLGLRRSYRDGRVTEVLSRQGSDLTLRHTTASGEVKSWRCNHYWVRLKLHPHQGPVPNYITLTGNGRSVEIGAFLSEEERLVLFDELHDYLNRL